MKKSVMTEGQPLFSIRAFGPRVVEPAPAPAEPKKGETKATRVFERVREEINSEHGVELDPESYEVTKQDEDIKRAIKFVIAEPDRAYRIAMKMEQGPPDIVDNNIAHVVAQMMIESGDLVDAVSTFKKISFSLTDQGKNIASEKSWVNANSEGHFIKLLLQSRMEKAGKGFSFTKEAFDPTVSGPKARVKKARRKVSEKTSKVKEEVFAAEINMDELQSIIDEQVCK
jgi:hypothetical protein